MPAWGQPCQAPAPMGLRLSPVCRWRTGCPPRPSAWEGLLGFCCNRWAPPRMSPNMCLCCRHPRQALPLGPLAVTLAPAPGDRPRGPGRPMLSWHSSVLYLVSEKGGVERRGENPRDGMVARPLRPTPRAWPRHCPPTLHPPPGAGCVHPTPQERKCDPWMPRPVPTARSPKGRAGEAGPQRALGLGRPHSSTLRGGSGPSRVSQDTRPRGMGAPVPGTPQRPQCALPWGGSGVSSSELPEPPHPHPGPAGSREQLADTRHLSSPSSLPRVHARRPAPRPPSWPTALPSPWGQPGRQPGGGKEGFCWPAWAPSSDPGRQTPAQLLSCLGLSFLTCTSDLSLLGAS